VSIALTARDAVFGIEAGDAVFGIEARGGSVGLSSIQRGSRAWDLQAIPAVQVLTAAQGHLVSSSRLAGSSLGAALRYRSHTSHERDWAPFPVDLAGGGRDRSVVGSRRVRLGSAAALRSRVTVRNVGAEPLTLLSVASWAAGFSASGASDRLASWSCVAGRSEWLAEGRWRSQPLRHLFPRMEHQLTQSNPRGAFVQRSSGTWSTGAELPVGALVSVPDGLCWLWQIEHNGPWRSEIGEDALGGYLALAGPTERDASWSHTLAPGESFTTVPVSMAVGDGLEDAVAQMTKFRRASHHYRAPRPVPPPVVYNDYMNTLNRNPSTERLLPLIEAAGRAAPRSSASTQDGSPRIAVGSNPSASGASPAVVFRAAWKRSWTRSAARGCSRTLAGAGGDRRRQPGRAVPAQ
jgi:alpha-galactosidase